MKILSFFLAMLLMATPASAAWLVIRWADSPSGTSANTDMPGDVVDIFDYDPWGLSRNLSLTPDQGGRYLVLNVTDKTKAELLPYISAMYDFSDPALPQIKYFRRYNVHKIHLPTPIVNQINSTGRYTTTWAVLSSGCSRPGPSNKCWYDKELAEDVANP